MCMTDFEKRGVLSHHNNHKLVCTTVSCSPPGDCANSAVAEFRVCCVSTVAEFRRTLLALAEALAEPGRRFTPDQVMLKGHELNPGLYGTCMKPL